MSELFNADAAGSLENSLQYYILLNHEGDDIIVAFVPLGQEVNLDEIGEASDYITKVVRRLPDEVQFIVAGWELYDSVSHEMLDELPAPEFNPMLPQ